MTVTNSNLNISQLSLQSLKEESFSEVPLNEQNSRALPTKYTSRRNNISSKSTTSIVGLGIRRPSDSILNEQVKKDRPFSSISTASTSSDTSSQDEFNSRVSSLTSYTTSPFISPTIPESKRDDMLKKYKTSPPGKLPIYDPSKSTTPKSSSQARANSSPMLHSELTPQQRYRLRRSQSKTTLRDLEKKYDDYEDADDDDISDDTLVWNVPLAVGSASSIFANEGNCHSPSMVNKILKGSSQYMTPSKLPGLLHDARSTPNLPASPLLRKQSSFATLSPIAKEISSFYDTSSSDYVKHELQKRKSFSASLPKAFADAQIHGFDDYKMISKEKAEKFSSSRPTWLPPKSSEEVKKHDKEIHQVLSNAAKNELKLKERISKKKETDNVNRQRYQAILDKDSIKYKHVKECGNMGFDTEIPQVIRCNLLIKLGSKLNAQIDMNKMSKEFDVALSKCSKIDFTTRSVEFEKINSIARRNYPVFKDETCQKFKDLQTLIKLNQVTDFEMPPFLTSKFLISGFSISQIFTMMKMFSLNCMNDANLFKYYNQIDSNTVLKKYLTPVVYKDEIEKLSFKLFLSVLPLEVMNRFFDIFMCLPDYKLMYALLMTVLRDYHLGFNSVKDLISNGQELQISTELDRVRFFEKLRYYYKRF